MQTTGQRTDRVRGSADASALSCTGPWVRLKLHDNHLPYTPACLSKDDKGPLLLDHLLQLLPDPIQLRKDDSLGLRFEHAW